MGDNKTNNASLVPHQSNSLVRAKGAIALANKLIFERAEHYFNAGMQKIRLQNYYGAIEAFSRALELNPNDDRFYFKRGYVKDCCQDHSGALDDINIAIELNPKVATYYGTRGAIRNIRFHDIKGYEEDNHMYYKLKNDGYYNFLIGNEKSKTKDYHAAVENYNKAIGLNSSDAQYYYMRGRAREELQDYQGARDDYEKAIELNSSAGYYHASQSYVLIMLKDYNRALELATKAIEMDSNDYEAYYNRGLAKFFLNDEIGAKEDYESFKIINPILAHVYPNYTN